MGFSSKLYGFHPKHGVKLVKGLVELYGKPFFYLNTTVFFSCVGIIYYLITTIQLPYYQSANVDAQTQSEMRAIAMSPWSCKGFIGTVADLLPLFGRQKFYYLLFFYFLGITSFVLLGFIPFSVVNRQPLIAGCAFFGLNLCSAACDLLVEAKYIELMQRNPSLKGSLLSYAWFCETCGQLIPSTFVGIIAEYTDVRVSFYIFFPLLLLPIPPIFMGGVINDTVPKEVSNKINFKRLASQWQLVILTFLQASMALILLFVTSINNSTIQFVYTIVCVCISITLSFTLLDHVTAFFVLHIFVYTSFYVNIQGALEYFYTAEPDCVPGGPNFSYLITTSLVPFFFTIAQFGAILSFQIIFTDWRFRSVYTLTACMKILSSIADLSIVNRWNKSIGIPDELVYLFGYSTFSQLASIISSLCNSYMISKLCPRNFEATMFAYIAGCSHFAVTNSFYFGVFLMDLVKIQSFVPCNYDGLTWLIIVGHVILPLLTIPLIYIAVPGIRLDGYIRDPKDDTLAYSIKKKKNKVVTPTVQV